MHYEITIFISICQPWAEKNFKYVPMAFIIIGCGYVHPYFKEGHYGIPETDTPAYGGTSYDIPEPCGAVPDIVR